MNISSPLNETNVVAPLGKQIAYMIEGFMILVSNVMVICTILYTKSLRRRKELLFFAMLSVSDLCFGVAYAHAGIRRFFIIFNRQDLIQVTPWECMLKLHNISFTLANWTNPVMMLIIAIDRLIAIVWYQQYAMMKRVVSPGSGISF